MVQAKHALFFHEKHSKEQSAALRLARSGAVVGILSCMLPLARLPPSLDVAALTQQSFLALHHTDRDNIMQLRRLSANPTARARPCTTRLQAVQEIWDTMKNTPCGMMQAWLRKPFTRQEHVLIV